jgi:hypothetical protein
MHRRSDGDIWRLRGVQALLLGTQRHLEVHQLLALRAAQVHLSEFTFHLDHQAWLALRDWRPYVAWRVVG